MTDWLSDKRWSDRFMTEIKQILGQCLINEASFEEDAEHNTDLMVLSRGDMRVGCRVRRNSFYRCYGHEFTIRSGRPNEVETELDKILAGWGDLFFYGFSTSDERALHAWVLADLAVFRHCYRQHGASLGTEKNNRDGSSCFHTFRWGEFPDGFVIANSENQAAQVETEPQPPPLRNC